MPRRVDLIDANGRSRTVQDNEPRGEIPTRKRLALFLLVTTCISTFFAGMIPGGGMPNLFLIVQLYQQGILPQAELLQFLQNGAYFSLALMAILGAHEMGHFLQAVRYKVPASLPYFIPMPITPFGTMGAVIFQGAGVADRKQMFDIAISGPLAGLVLALPIAFYGVSNSETAIIPPEHQGASYGDPLILEWMVEAVHGPMAENEDVLLNNNPLLFAGWVGIFITALNLIPIGQLDGGHILYSLFRKRAHAVATTLLWGAVGYMVYTGYYAYLMMVILLMFMGPRHPPTANDYVPLGTMRIILGWLTLGFIIIGFTPMPLK